MHKHLQINAALLFRCRTTMGRSSRPDAALSREWSVCFLRSELLLSRGHLHHNCCSHRVPRHVRPRDSGRALRGGTTSPQDTHSLSCSLYENNLFVKAQPALYQKQSLARKLFSGFVAVLSSPARSGLIRDTHGSHRPAARLAPHALIVSLIDF